MVADYTSLASSAFELPPSHHQYGSAGHQFATTADSGS
jgi:hypothetical protein